MPVGPDRPEPWPTDPAAAAARLMLLVLDIEERTQEDHDVLLADLLRVAWPTSRGQDQ